MKKIFIFAFLSIFLIFLVANISSLRNVNLSNTNKVSCPQDVKRCPNGDFVSRNPDNNCRFDPCPEYKNNSGSEKEVCCAISDSMSGSTPSYRIMKESACRNIEGLMNVSREIVNDSFCNEKTMGIARGRPKLNSSQIKNLIQERNRLMIHAQNGTCPERCDCAGSVMKCELANGTRELTVRAGNSDNMIIQVKGINASTKVELYKGEDGRIYAINKNNETKEIRMLPDQVKERIKKRINARLERENITLNEDGTYDYQAEKRIRFLGIIPLKTRVKARINAETGEVTGISKPKWWEFLAKEEKDQPLLGESCGTVTPGYNDACCQTKGYDVWNQETGECEFLKEE